MKIAVINFSGNVGKSTLSKHMLLPRLKDAEYIAVESINADEGGGELVRGKQYGALQEQLMLLDSAIVDVGASNVEEFIRQMQQYRGSHEDYDIFLVPTVKESKQIKDTIGTIEALAAMGVPAKKIKLVFNKLESDETVEDVFFPLIAYHAEKKNFTLKQNAALYFSELYQKLRTFNMSVDDLLADQTDYKAKLKEAKTQDEKMEAASKISMRRLATSAKENLDTVFSLVVK